MIALVAAVIAVSWIGLGFTPILPTWNPFVNLSYARGWIEGRRVPIEEAELIYPGRIMTEGQQPILVRDLDDGCAFHYLPAQEIESTFFATVNCEDYDSPGIPTYSFQLPLREEPSTSGAFAVGHNRAVVRRLLEERRLTAR